MKGPWRQLRSAWRALRRSSHLDAAMQEEMRFHIEMEAERLVREQGLDPQEARRQAYVRFGGVEKYKEADATRAGVSGLTRSRSIRDSASACSSSTAG